MAALCLGGLWFSDLVNGPLDNGSQRRGNKGPVNSLCTLDDNMRKNASSQLCRPPLKTSCSALSYHSTGQRALRILHCLTTILSGRSQLLQIQCILTIRWRNQQLHVLLYSQLMKSTFFTFCKHFPHEHSKLTQIPLTIQDFPKALESPIATKPCRFLLVKVLPWVEYRCKSVKISHIITIQSQG